MKSVLFKLLSVFLLIFLLTITGCTRHFMILPQKKNLDFTVEGRFGKLHYYPVSDNRNELDRKGQESKSCGEGTPGVTILGDKNYKPGLLVEVNNHMKTSLYDANLFSAISDSAANIDADYTIKVNLDRFNVVLDEAKARQTEACIGGIVGAAIAASVDVQATSDIALTVIFFKGTDEVWRKSVSKRITRIDDYSKTTTNAESVMGESIGEATKELISELAKYLSIHS